MGGRVSAGYKKFDLIDNGVLVSYDDSDQVYETDVLSARAVEFVSRTAQSGNPFFLYVAPHASHARPIPAARHEGEFAAAPPHRPPSFNQMRVDTPPWVRALPELNAEDTAKIDATARARKETLLALDELVGAVLSALEQAGILDQTFIVLTSDNGFHLGEHRIPNGKGTAYDEAIRVPLVIRGPEVPASRTTALVSDIDLAPTIATWADVEIPAFVDGRSLTPLISGDPGPWRQAVLAQLHRDNPDKVDGPPAFRALRGDDFMYAEYDDGFRQLYDLSVDPYELDNLAAAANPGVITELSEALAALATCAGADCRAVEETLLPVDVVGSFGSRPSGD